MSGGFESRGRGTAGHEASFDYAPPAPRPAQPRELTAEDRARTASTIARNVDGALDGLAAAVWEVEAAAEGNRAEDLAKYRAGRQRIDASMSYLAELAKSAATAVNDAANEDVRAKLEGIASLLTEMTVAIASLPAPPQVEGPQLSCEGALLAMLPPDAPVARGAEATYSNALNGVRGLIRQMTFADMTAMQTILRQHPEHEISRRIARMNPERRNTIHADLADTRLRLQARSREAAQRRIEAAAPAPFKVRRIEIGSMPVTDSPGFDDSATAGTRADAKDRSDAAVEDPSASIPEPNAPQPDRQPDVPSANDATEAPAAELPQGDHLPHLADMETAFGESLGHIEAHTGMAAELAPHGAQAMTVGNNIMFADAQPSAALTAHEATHALQNQRAGASAAMAAGLVAPRDCAAEAEADANAARVAAHGPARLPPVTASPAAHVQLARTSAAAEGPHPEEKLDPAAEASLLGALNDRVPADDPAAIQARVRTLTALFRAVPSDARLALHARLSGAAKDDDLAHAFYATTHPATRARLLRVLRGDAVPLPTRHDAMTREGFVAKLGLDPATVKPSPLALTRFYPEITAELALTSEFGPPTDEPAVTAVFRVFDGDDSEHGVDRISWPSADPSSQPAVFQFSKGGTYRVEIEIQQGGLVIAQRTRELTVQKAENDVEAVAVMTPEQLQEQYHGMGDRLATAEGLSKDDRGDISADRNLIEFFAMGKGVSLERQVDPPDAITIGAMNLRISKDPVFVRQWIERTFLTMAPDDHGPKMYHQLHTKLMEDLDRARHTETQLRTDLDPAYRSKVDRFVYDEVIPVLWEQLELFQQEMAAFEERFGNAAKTKLRTMLAESRVVAEGELARYGITTTGGCWGTDENGYDLCTPIEAHGADNEAADGMAKAAAQLVANQREMDKMRERLGDAGLALYMKTGRLVPDEETQESDPELAGLSAKVDALRRLVAEAEAAHAQWIELHTTEYPILASYKRYVDDRVELDIDGLEKLTGPGRAQSVYDRIMPVIANLDETEANFDDIDVWKEPRILQRTMPDFAIAPGSLHAQMIQRRSMMAQREGWWKAYAIGALTFALALAAAIPTGGSSLAAAGVVVAEIGGAALDIYLLADHLAEYDLDRAKTGTDLDKAKVISTKEPSLFWLAFDIVLTGIGLAAATRVFGDIAERITKAGPFTRAETEEAIAHVHKLAREGKLSADGAIRAEQEILARHGAGIDVSKAGDARARVSTDRLDELSNRLGVPVHIDDTGELASGVQMHYVSRADGGIDVTHVRVGPGALIDDILAHHQTIRAVTRYNGAVGKLRQLWDRLVVMLGGMVNPFRPGSKAFESFHELSKHSELIAQRRYARMGETVDPAILDEEIAFLESSRARHEEVVRKAEESGGYGQGAGHIDAPEMSKAYDPNARAPDPVYNSKPDYDHLPKRDDLVGAGGHPETAPYRDAKDILEQGPRRTMDDLADHLPDDMTKRPDMEVLGRHATDLDAHELEYMRELREAVDAGEDAATVGSHKGKLTEVEGERAATKFMLAEEPGTELVRGFEVGDGFDQIWVRRGPDGEIVEYIIVEAKGPGASLGMTKGKGKQMSDEWVSRTVEDLADEGQLGRDMLKALEDGKPPVTGRVVEADGAGGYLDRTFDGQRGLPDKGATFRYVGKKE